ncbi:hypothetical protein H0H92_007267 [Tricholoma furcatifolium]|nr:hypothetical protein H0H92_007267 [Tricholoma furcatifolium]
MAAAPEPKGVSTLDEKEQVAEKVNEKISDRKADLESVEFLEPASTDYAVLESERDIATTVISVADDPSLNTWTIRAFVIGIGLSTFAEIYYFKPVGQTVSVSTMFIAIIAYVLGTAWASFVPSRGIFRYLNPHPFNKKENAFIVIMASAAATSALGTEVLATQRLFYDITPNAGASIFLLFSSQLMGYGIGGLFRSVLLYPSKMLYPAVLPLVSMFETLFRGSAQSTNKKLRVFWIVFGVIFIWELFPEWMFPLLTGFSIFCLANPNSQGFTRLFGGSNGNEGLGFLSICFDWQYIAGSYNPFTIPLKAQFSNLVGYLLCIVVFIGVYYMNIWESQTFPFLSQELFYANGSLYDQLLILNDKYEVDPALLAEQGLPYYAGTWVVQLLTTNLGMAATFTHLLLWNREDLRDAWVWLMPSELKKKWATFDIRFWKDDGMREQAESDEDIDPHYREMLKYADAPNSWYVVVLAASIIMALVIIYKTGSTLPWWGFLISVLLATISIVFFGALYAITGLQFIIQPFVQMIGGFLHPGKPMANMYFVLFSYNAVNQAQLLLRDLKIAQYTKLPPRAAFTAQIIGTLFGAILNFVLMNTIIDNQEPILLSVEGTNIWSGQQPQQYNSQAIAWGGLRQLFAVGQRYQWVAWAYVVGLFVPVPFWIIHRYFPKLRADYLYTPVICYYIGWLCVGINSSILTYFVIAWLSQWWLRTRYPKWGANQNGDYAYASCLNSYLTKPFFTAPPRDVHLLPVPATISHIAIVHTTTTSMMQRPKPSKSISSDRSVLIKQPLEQKSPYTSEWEDVEDIENQPRPLTPESSASVRMGMSSPHRRRFVQRTTFIASPARKQPPTPSKSRKTRKSVSRDDMLDGAVQGASFTFRYFFDVFFTAIKLLRRPLGILLFLWLLAFIIGRISTTMRSAFAPLCLLPGLYGSRFCEAPMPPPGTTGLPRWADYPKFIDVQSTTFEHLLDDSVGGSGLSLELKKAELATSDLVTLVRVSDLKARDTLGDNLNEFVDDAKKTGRDLQRLSSKIGGAVDNIMAVNDYALNQIESAHSAPPTITSLYGLIKWSAEKPANDIVISTFAEAMGVLSSNMERLILEAELNLANLERLEERLSTLHEIVAREDRSISGAKSELLAELWTKLGGNQKRLRNFDDHLFLLKNLNSYRKKALAHVVAALQTLHKMSSDMEDIRERVAAPDLMGPRIPIEVHMKSIRTGLERLKEGRVRAKKLEEETIHRVLGIAD